MIRVVPHDSDWARQYAEEARRIASVAPAALDLHHIGSTSIPGILAKPIIDMLGTVPDLAMIDAATSAFETLGYLALGEFGIPGRRYLRRDDAAGVRSHHLHVFEQWSDGAERHLAFRDYLRAHPAVARDYSELKARITRVPVDAATYMDAKHPFIAETEARAVAWYRTRQGG